MFSVIISEKGGAERRETFDRTEINVGRVQGNDLMLPKGNVSKRHARLLYRDGRFIVTDLKSTNGTYVNGRKIAQATIVREGDKIYIGDFVLRIETAASGTAPPDSTAPPARALDELSVPDAPPPPVPEPRPSSSFTSPPNAPASGDKSLLQRSAPQISEKIEPSRTSQGVISHFPLENDPDESVEPANPVPGPPRVPSPRPAFAPNPQNVTGSSTLAIGSSTTPNLPQMRGEARPANSGATAQLPRPQVGPSVPPPQPIPSAPGSSSAAVHPSVVPIPSRRAIPPVSDRIDRAQAESTQAVAHRKALARLSERIGEAVDLTPLDSGAPAGDALAQTIEQAAAASIAAMREVGELPSEVDADAVVSDVQRELLKLGPIERLLDDDEVSEIQVFRHDYVVAMHGRRRVVSEVAFTAERAVARVIRRLCMIAGAPLAEGSSFVERLLPSGRRLFAILPPASACTLVIRKAVRPEATLDDFVRSGAISRAMAGLLSQCVAGRGNILITGTRDAGTTWLLGALVAAGHADDRVVTLQDEDELLLDSSHTVSISLGSTSAERSLAVQAAARIRPDRLVVSAFTGHVAAEVVDAIGGGMDGVLAAARAPTLRQAVTRLAADIAACRPGITPDAAREWLASSFDLAIEIALLRDGRHRVLRIAELALEAGQVALRDVFTFVVERTAAGGALEGTFHASGLVPDIVEDLQSRGLTFDTSSSFRRNR